MFYSPPTPSIAADSFPERSAWKLAALEALVELGLELAREQLRQVMNPATHMDPAAASLAHSRISRAVRQALALHALIEAGGLSQMLMAQAGRVAQTPAAQAREPIETDDDAPEALDPGSDRDDDRPERAERLFDDLKTPIADLVALVRQPESQSMDAICRGLGIAFDPALWEEETWTIAAAHPRPRGAVDPAGDGPRRPPPRSPTPASLTPPSLTSQSPSPTPPPSRSALASILLAPTPSPPGRRAALLGTSGVWTAARDGPPPLPIPARAATRTKAPESERPRSPDPRPTSGTRFPMPRPRPPPG